MKSQKYLSLCDPHNSIIHEFGCDSSCTRTAGICLKGCSEYDHMQKNLKHQFINAKQFYSILGSIRQRYCSFSTDFKQVYLKRYVKQLKEAVNSFQEYVMTDFLEKTPLIDIFSKSMNSTGDMFQELIEDSLGDIEMAEIKCKEIAQIKNFELSLQKERKEDQQKRMIKLLSRILEFYLKNYNLLPQNKIQQKKNKPFEMIELDTLQSLAKSEVRSMYLDMMKNKKIDQLLITINEDISQQLKKGHLNITKNIDNFFNFTQECIQKTSPQNLTLAVKTSLVQNPFWQQFILFIKNKGLKQLKIFTTIQQDSKYLQTQLDQNPSPHTSITLLKWDQQPSMLLPKQ